MHMMSIPLTLLRSVIVLIKKSMWNHGQNDGLYGSAGENNKV